MKIDKAADDVSWLSGELGWHERELRDHMTKLNAIEWNTATMRTHLDTITPGELKEVEKKAANDIGDRCERIWEFVNGLSDHIKGVAPKMPRHRRPSS